MKRTIAVVTSSRADYSHLYWPLQDLSRAESVDLRLIALGPHLSPEFGYTVREIEKDGLAVDERVECLIYNPVQNHCVSSCQFYSGCINDHALLPGLIPPAVLFT